MKKIAALLVGVILSFSLAGCGNKTVSWNGKTAEMVRLTMIVDFTDKYIYAGMVDYVFVGTVEEIVNNVIPNKVNDHKDYYSTYKIHVDKNLKGELMEDIICSKFGGFRKDGTMYLVSAESPNGTVVSDTGLPEVNKQYVFMAYAQSDGSLSLSEIFDNRECTDEIIAEYQEYIENEITFDRERFASAYDLSK